MCSEHKLPSKINDADCELCKSETVWEETCSDLETSSDSVFIMVSASGKYVNAVLNITGANLKFVDDLQNGKSKGQVLWDKTCVDDCTIKVVVWSNFG